MRFVVERLLCVFPPASLLPASDVREARERARQLRLCRRVHTSRTLSHALKKQNRPSLSFTHNKLPVKHEGSHKHHDAARSEINRGFLLALPTASPASGQQDRALDQAAIDRRERLAGAGDLSAADRGAAPPAHGAARGARAALLLRAASRCFVAMRTVTPLHRLNCPLVLQPHTCPGDRGAPARRRGRRALQRRARRRAARAPRARGARRRPRGAQRAAR